MYELKVSVKKVMGECTANPPMRPGDYFTVKDGDIQVPEGGYICAWALQSLIPLLTPKERDIAEEKDADWMWRVKHAQCPDPSGRVVFQIEQTGTLDPNEKKGHRGKGEVIEPHLQPFIDAGLAAKRNKSLELPDDFYLGIGSELIIFLPTLPSAQVRGWIGFDLTVGEWTTETWEAGLSFDLHY